MLKTLAQPTTDNLMKIKRLKETNLYKEANDLIALGWQILNIRITSGVASGLKNDQEGFIFTLGHQSLSPPEELQQIEIQIQTEVLGV